jgi:predicted Zn finger-like uncharacterized protein
MPRYTFQVNDAHGSRLHDTIGIDASTVEEALSQVAEMGYVPTKLWMYCPRCFGSGPRLCIDFVAHAGKQLTYNTCNTFLLVVPVAQVRPPAAANEQRPVMLVVACPHCQAKYKVDLAAQGGIQVKCVKCQQPFTLPPKPRPAADPRSIFAINTSGPPTARSSSASSATRLAHQQARKDTAKRWGSIILKVLLFILLELGKQILMAVAQGIGSGSGKLWAERGGTYRCSTCGTAYDARFMTHCPNPNCGAWRGW